MAIPAPAVRPDTVATRSIKLRCLSERESGKNAALDCSIQERDPPIINPDVASIVRYPPSDLMERGMASKKFPVDL